ncbi:MAG TPA: polysaccharide deacetylase family protein, partial [Thermoanaerobaculia bacterium]|nr:polysaccharide deacetylase family protein [Thermoanaerobaculia bacterium]
MTLRSQLKTAAAWAVNRSGAGAFARARAHRDLPFIVGYHRVVARVGAVSALPAMEVSTAMLENHLDWIARHFRIISLDDIPGAMRQGRHAKPAAVITFDDGYSDVYHHAFPLLKRKGIPAGVFVVTDLVGTTKLPIHEEVYAALSNSGHADPFAATQQLLRTRPQADVLAVIGARDRQAP